MRNNSQLPHLDIFHETITITLIIHATPKPLVWWQNWHVSHDVIILPAWLCQCGPTELFFHPWICILCSTNVPSSHEWSVLLCHSEAGNKFWLYRWTTPVSSSGRCPWLCTWCRPWAVRMSPSAVASLNRMSTGWMLWFSSASIFVLVVLHREHPHVFEVQHRLNSQSMSDVSA